MRPYGETPKKYVKGCRTWRRNGGKIHVGKCVKGSSHARQREKAEVQGLVPADDET